MASLPERATLAFFVLATLAVLIASQIVPKWYITETVTTVLRDGQLHQTSVKLDIGMWKRCASTSVVKICRPYLGGGVTIFDLDSALRSAQAFSIIATFMAGVGAIIALVIDFQQVSDPTTLRIPGVMFIVTALFTAIGAFSFVALVNKTSIGASAQVARYGASFIIAWLSVGTACVSAGLSHRLYSQTVQELQD